MPVNSYCFYKTVQHATAVTDAVSCKFTSLEDDNLVLAKGNVLEVYKLACGGHEKEEAELILVGQYILNGVIQSIVAAKINPKKKDSLVLSFGGHKVVMIDFDESIQDIITVSLFNLQKGLKLSNNTTKLDIRIDPQNRCVAIRLSTSQLFVLPLSDAVLTTEEVIYKPIEESEEDDFMEENKQITGGRSKFEDIFVIDLKEIGINRVKDFCFLHGYHAPELLILYESNLTWAGRLAVKSSVCSLRTMSLNLPGKSWDIIHKANDLSFDSYKLKAVPEPVGGALIFSNHSVLHFGQTIDYGLTLNSFGDEFGQSSQLSLEKLEKVMTLENVNCTFLSPQNLLVGDFSGQLHLLTLRTDRKLTLEKLGYSDLTSCMCTLNENYIFLGSRLGDSLLVHFEEENQDSNEKKRESSSPIDRSPKRRKLNSGQSSHNKEEELKRILSVTNTEEKTFKSASYNFKMHDSVGNVAPFADMSIGTSLLESDSGTDNRKILEIIGCVGQAKNGALTIVRQGLHPNVMLSYGQLGAANGCWTLYCSPEMLSQKMEQTQGNESENRDSDWHSFLITSHRDRSIVLSTEETLQEVNTDFYTKGPTRCCGHIFGRKYMCQVYIKGIRLLKDAECVENVKDIEFTSKVVEADICDPYIFVRLENHEIKLFKVEQNLEIIDTGFKDTNAVLAPGIKKHLVEFDEHFVQLITMLKAGDSVDEKIIQVQNLRKTYEVDSLIAEEFEAIDQQLILLTDSLQREENVDSNLTLTLEVKRDSYRQKMFKKLGNVTSLCLFQANDRIKAKLKSKSFSTSGENEISTQLREKDVSVSSIPDKKVLDNDDLFYKMIYGGDGDGNVDDSDDDEEIPEDLEDVKPKKAAKESDEENQCILAVSVRAYGRLEIRSLPDMKLVFWANGFQNGYNLLQNGICDEDVVEHEENSERVVEVCLTTLRKDGTVPYILSFLDSGDLLVYKMFFYDSTSAEINKEDIDTYLPIRFQRVSHGYITRPFTGTDGNDEDVEEDDQTKKYNWFGGHRIVPFHNISQRSGVFIGGDNPGWIFGFRDYFRIHPMTTSVGVSTFTGFHHSNCENGMIYFTMDEDGCLKIGTLPMKQVSNDHANYDCEFTRQKVPLNHTAHKIVRHSESNTYVVVIAKKAEVKSLELATDRTLPAYDDLYELRLYNPKTWRTFYSYDQFYFMQDEEEVSEHVLALEEVILNTPLTSGKEVMKSYIAVGTGTARGEAYTCQGRIFLWRVRESQETRIIAEGHLERMRRFDMELVLRRQERGPVTAICSLMGLLCLAVGSKIMLYKWSNETLIPCAFYNAHLFTVGLKSLKNYVLVSDVFDSVTLLLWEGDTLQLVLLGRDDNPLQVYSSEFLVDGDDLNLVVADKTGSIQIFSYQPYQHGQFSRGGKKLVRRSDICVGTQINTMMQLRTHSLFDNSIKHYMNICGGLDGSLSYITPIDESMYKRLQSLYALMVSFIKQDCALNPKEFRMSKSQNRKQRSQTIPILDGDLLWKYLSFSNTDQEKLAKKIGSTSSQIISNLQTIYLSTRLF